MDSVAGEAAYLGQTEIVNSSRTHTYLSRGFGPETVNIYGNCGCPQIRDLAECDPSPYFSPAFDPAPWYDAAIPESGDFAGFYPVSFEGMGSTLTREIFPRLSGGSVLGRIRPGPRTMTWKGFLFGRTCCSVAYGLRWLTSQLNATCDDTCLGESLDLLVCCPPVNEGCVSADCNGCPENVLGVPANDDAFRTLFDVGLTEGPLILSERRAFGSSCGCGSGAIMEVEFTLVAANPFLHRQPVVVCDSLFTVPTTCVQFLPATSNAPCAPIACPTPVDCTTDAGCPSPALPVIPPFLDPCQCDPIDPTSVCCAISKNTFRQFSEGVVQVELKSGDAALRNITIKFFENSMEKPCSDIDQCSVCSELKIRFIPANSTMFIDGTTRRITIQCTGGNIESAEHLTVSPFGFPVLRCISYCVCTTVEGNMLSPGASVKVSVVPREI